MISFLPCGHRTLGLLVATVTLAGLFGAAGCGSAVVEPSTTSSGNGGVATSTSTAAAGVGTSSSGGTGGATVTAPRSRRRIAGAQSRFTMLISPAPTR